MKSLRVRIRYTQETIHPMHQFVCQSPDVDREVVLQGHAPDGSGTLLLYVEGDRAAYEARMESLPFIEPFDVTDGDDGFFVYARETMQDRERQFVDAFDRETVIVVPPVEFRPDMTVRLTVVGPPEELQTALDELPEGVDVTVLRVGEYGGAVGGSLTDRQREALGAAWETGYYEVPREGDLDAIAEELDCASSTASDLLRRAERQLVGEALDRNA